MLLFILFGLFQVTYLADQGERIIADGEAKEAERRAQAEQMLREQQEAAQTTSQVL